MVNLWRGDGMKKILFGIIIILLLNLSLVSAVTQQEMNEAKGLIDSKADCKSLSDSQLEIIGEYYMEQMHPGEAHELMHKMMGLKEGSEAEEQFHINMAKTIYCGESSGMMSMMNTMMGSGMQGGMMPIMGGVTYQNQQNTNYADIINILLIVLLMGLIVLVYLFVMKTLPKRKRR